MPRSQTDRHDNGSANGLSVRLFQQSCSPTVERHRACLPRPLKLRLALVQSNYHLLLVVCNGTLLCPSLLSLCALISPALSSYIVLDTFAVCESQLIMQIVKPHESLLPQRGGNKHEPLVFHYTDTCQADFNLSREEIQC